MGRGQCEALQRRTLPQFGRATSVTRCAGHGGNKAKIVGTEHEIDLGKALQDSIAHLLGDTPSDPDGAPGRLILPETQSAEVAVQLLLRLVPDRAGVHEEQVGGILARSRLVAGMTEQVLELLRVVDIHLAPVGADGVTRLRHGGQHYPTRPRGQTMGSEPPASTRGANKPHEFHLGSCFQSTKYPS